MQQGLLITRLTDTSGQPPDTRSHQQAVDNLLSTGLLLPDEDFRKGTVYRLFGKNNPAATEVAWMTPTNEVDIERWVDDAPTHQRGFREAVHIILDSIGHSRNLQARMVVKGSRCWPSAMTAAASPVIWTSPPRRNIRQTWPTSFSTSSRND